MIKTKIPLSELSSMKMVAGNEKRIGKVIYDGKVKEWVGIGWIDLRKPTKEDEKTIPMATEHPTKKDCLAWEKKKQLCR